ncbi:MAG: hypothetical protein WBS54_01400 [Acidobacteriota bacterium]
MALAKLDAEDSVSKFKTAIYSQLFKLGPTDPESWGRAVFRALTGADLEEVDWSQEQNRTGYRLWTQSFNLLVHELLQEGMVRVEGADAEGRLIMATATRPAVSMPSGSLLN